MTKAGSARSDDACGVRSVFAGSGGVGMVQCASLIAPYAFRYAFRYAVGYDFGLAFGLAFGYAVGL